MRKAKTLLRLNVISQVEGKNLGTVRDLVFDENAKQLLALLLTDRELFGLLDAQVVPFAQVRDIGPDAVMVPNAESLTKAHSDPVIARAFDAKTIIAGKRITTQGGEHLGTIADVYIDETGRVVGFEISGGLLSDAFNGKRYIDAPEELTVGEDVILVPHNVAAVLLRQKDADPRGLNAAAKDATVSTAEIGAKVNGFFKNAGASLTSSLESASASLGTSYGNIAKASVERQREWVIGKVASRDVTLPAPEVPVAETVDGAETVAIVPTEVVEPTPLVRQGETITAAQADAAIAAGALGQLILAAAGTVASNTFNSGKEGVSSVGTSARSSLEQAAIGKPAAKEVMDRDGNILVFEGEIITPEVLDNADRYGKKAEIIAAANLGAAGQTLKDGLQSAQEGAVSLWDQIKARKAEFDARGQEKKINAALGRPVTRVILDRSDNIILNTGELVTNSAVQRAREAGVLDILLDSVADVEPEIAPSMLRADDRGQAALPSQPDVEFKPSPVYEVHDETEKTDAEKEPATAGPVS